MSQPVPGRARARAALLPSLPASWVAHSRLIGLSALTCAVAAFLAYMVMDVPLVEAQLPRSEAGRYWEAAVIGALIVAVGVVVTVVCVVVRRRGAPPRGSLVVAADAPRVPAPLRWQFVPPRVVRLAAVCSAVGGSIALALGAPLWGIGLALAGPWLPLVTVESERKHAAYGVFGIFAAVTFAQVMHMGEHAVQVTQLLMTDGVLARSHGVFGQLDFELVHFVTDTALWFTLGALLVVMRGRNTWLWIAFAAASFHQVEHFYLMWLNTTHESFYTRGGFAGIMGDGGMVGSPLDRPYLHFSYNFIVIVPMLVALWDEARRVERDRPARP